MPVSNHMNLKVQTPNTVRYGAVYGPVAHPHRQSRQSHHRSYAGYMPTLQVHTPQSKVYVDRQSRKGSYMSYTSQSTKVSHGTQSSPNACCSTWYASASPTTSSILIFLSHSPLKQKTSTRTRRTRRKGLGRTMVLLWKRLTKPFTCHSDSKRMSFMPPGFVAVVPNAKASKTSKRRSRQ
jgi:hypothetical protein